MNLFYHVCYSFKDSTLCSETHCPMSWDACETCTIAQQAQGPTALWVPEGTQLLALLFLVLLRTSLKLCSTPGIPLFQNSRPRALLPQGPKRHTPAHCVSPWAVSNATQYREACCQSTMDSMIQASPLCTEGEHFSHATQGSLLSLHRAAAPAPPLRKGKN
jgi:hypothetical protein